MSNSVELRSPMLDLDLIKFVINLPMDQKFNQRSHFSSKFLLRKLATQKIGNFFNYPKEGNRNYSKKISADPYYWDINHFCLKEILDIPSSLNWRDRFSLINLEIFHRLFFLKEDFEIEMILTKKGCKELLKR